MRGLSLTAGLAAFLFCAAALIATQSWNDSWFGGVARGVFAFSLLMVLVLALVAWLAASAARNARVELKPDVDPRVPNPVRDTRLAIAVLTAGVLVLAVTVVLRNA